MDDRPLLTELVKPAAERRSDTSSTLRGWLRLRLGYVVALFLIGLTAYVFFKPAATWRTMAAKDTALSKVPIADGKPGADVEWPAHTSNRRVPLEAHIMSKCPDAVDCLRDLVLPTMQQISDKVDFTLSFIGRPTSDGGVECMHGPAECMGNILELCAQKLYPDPKIYLGFTMCISYDYQHIPDRELVEGCALEHAVDIAALNECAMRDDGQYAVNMLRDSVQHTRDVGVTKSCTVRLDNKVYCIRDNAQWTNCPAGPGVHDLIINVEKLYRQD